MGASSVSPDGELATREISIREGGERNLCRASWRCRFGVPGQTTSLLRTDLAPGQRRDAPADRLPRQACLRAGLRDSGPSADRRVEDGGCAWFERAVAVLPGELECAGGVFASRSGWRRGRRALRPSRALIGLPRGAGRVRGESRRRTRTGRRRVRGGPASRRAVPGTCARVRTPRRRSKRTGRHRARSACTASRRPRASGSARPCPRTPSARSSELCRSGCVGSAWRRRARVPRRPPAGGR